MKKARALIEAAKQLTDPDLARFQQGFFKTQPGGYGEGDKFLGLVVPQTRHLARDFRDLSMKDVCDLLKNPYHELRLTALHILVDRFTRAKDEVTRKNIVDDYLKHLDYVNNWDLVDTSAYKILGRWLLDNKDRSILWDLAKSGHLWRERVAVVATMWLIKRGQFDDILALADYFLTHKHDLMHKAVGWMLREVGNQDLAPLRAFLDKHAAVMPRTMLRYAIERMTREERTHYMTLKAHA